MYFDDIFIHNNNKEEFKWFEPEINKARKKLEKLNKDTEELIKYDEVLNYIANQQIEIDLDDVVQENYEKFADVLTRI